MKPTKYFHSNFTIEESSSQCLREAMVSLVLLRAGQSAHKQLYSFISHNNAQLRDVDNPDQQ